MSTVENPPRERGKWLSGWLIYVVLANLWTAYRLIDAYVD